MRVRSGNLGRHRGSGRLSLSGPGFGAVLVCCIDGNGSVAALAFGRMSRHFSWIIQVSRYRTAVFIGRSVRWVRKRAFRADWRGFGLIFPLGCFGFGSSVSLPRSLLFRVRDDNLVRVCVLRLYIYIYLRDRIFISKDF